MFQLNLQAINAMVRRANTMDQARAKQAIWREGMMEMIPDAHRTQRIDDMMASIVDVEGVNAHLVAVKVNQELLRNQSDMALVTQAAGMQ